jgi:hypothetical protein
MTIVSNSRPYIPRAKTAAEVLDTSRVEQTALDALLVQVTETRAKLSVLAREAAARKRRIYRYRCHMKSMTSVMDIYAMTRDLLGDDFEEDVFWQRLKLPEQTLSRPPIAPSNGPPQEPEPIEPPDHSGPPAMTPETEPEYFFGDDDPEGYPECNPNGA